MSYDVISIENSGELRNGVLSIAVSNIHVHESDIFASATGHPNLSDAKYRRITSLLDNALKTEHHVDLIILPEVSVPHSYLGMMQRFCRRREVGLIFGMEHRLVTHECPEPTDIGTGYNHVVTLLPCRRRRWFKECRTHTRLKRHYSPAETQGLLDRRVALPSPMQPYQLFHWRESYFTVFNCYELANIEDRAQFRSKIDFMVTAEWNPDTNYFANIAESTARDLHCYFVQVNTSQYCDSRIVSPTKTEKMDLLRTKGGKNEAVLIEDLDIVGLRAFQAMAASGQRSDGRFKITPPDFDLDEVDNRIANGPPL